MMQASARNTSKQSVSVGATTKTNASRQELLSRLKELRRTLKQTRSACTEDHVAGCSCNRVQSALQVFYAITKWRDNSNSSTPEQQPPAPPPLPPPMPLPPISLPSMPAPPSPPRLLLPSARRPIQRSPPVISQECPGVRFVNYLIELAKYDSVIDHATAHALVRRVLDGIPQKDFSLTHDADNNNIDSVVLTERGLFKICVLINSTGTLALWRYVSRMIAAKSEGGVIGYSCTDVMPSIETLRECGTFETLYPIDSMPSDLNDMADLVDEAWKIDGLGGYKNQAEYEEECALFDQIYATLESGMPVCPRRMLDPCVFESIRNVALDALRRKLEQTAEERKRVQQDLDHVRRELEELCKRTVDTTPTPPPTKRVAPRGKSKKAKK